MQQTNRPDNKPLNPNVGNACSVQVGSATNAEWSNVVQCFEDVTLYQTWAYGSAHWGAEAIEHVVFRRNGEAIGCAQARIMKVPLVGWGLAYVPWGPLWWQRGRERNLDHIRLVARAAREEYVVRRHMSVVLIPNVMETEPDASTITAILREAKFEQMPDMRQTLLFDLAPTCADLRRSCSRIWRKGLRRAEASGSGLKLVWGTDLELLQAFARIYREMLVRKKFVPGVAIEEFFSIQSQLPEPLRMNVCLCYQGEEAVAGLVFSATGNRGLMLLAATTQKGRLFGASHLIWSQVLQSMRDKGYALCDLGGIDAVEAPGPYHFKKGLNGFESRRIGFFYTSPGVLGDMLIGTAYRVKPLLRKAKGLKLKLHR